MLNLFSSFSRLREAENEYHEKVTEAVMSTFDKLAKGDMEELSDVLRDVSI
jgi:division protein CdvB (Snf7/Vps24/ESCRT-III family)